MSLEYIRKSYDVPAYKGGRIEYTGSSAPILGTIEGANGAHVMIRLDGNGVARPFHPTWKLRYIREGFDHELRELGL